MDDILVDFFSRSSENRMNKSILYCKANRDEERKYISQLIDRPLNDYIVYACSDAERKMITSKDVIQFSSFENSTIKICEKLKEVDNPGLKFLDIGKLLLDDGKKRKDGALIKYGENHAKVATAFGLVFEFYKTYYLSCVGNVYLELEEESRKKLLDRLIVRSTLVSRMIQASQNGSVNMREFLFMLSDSTYLRRKSNIKTVVDYLYKSEEYDFETFVELIKF